ncbi:MAG: tryptophan synthase subunit alpha [Aquabacterium sp.]|nr:tryptophan synthase subunit alpha [Aquabacterium sp.]
MSTHSKVVTRLDKTFATLKEQGRKALIPYITCGDPYPEKTVELMLAMAEAGADVIELGVPFSDPMADGPVIQKAAERALAKGISLNRVLDDVKAFRAKNADTPVVLMGYANPIECYDLHHGAGSFVREAKACGVDGVLVVDYPPEECEEFAARLKAADLAPIFLLAPTSTVPVGVGFGIRDAETAKAVAAVSDAVVIGSRIVQLLETQTPDTVVAAGRGFIAEIRTALDSLKGN